jgi:hypothetical protein
MDIAVISKIVHHVQAARLWIDDFDPWKEVTGHQLIDLYTQNKTMLSTADKINFLCFVTRICRNENSAWLQTEALKLCLEPGFINPTSYLRLADLVFRVVRESIEKSTRSHRVNQRVAKLFASFDMLQIEITDPSTPDNMSSIHRLLRNYRWVSILNEKGGTGRQLTKFLYLWVINWRVPFDTCIHWLGYLAKKGSTLRPFEVDQVIKVSLAYTSIRDKKTAFLWNFALFLTRTEGLWE